MTISNTHQHGSEIALGFAIVGVGGTHAGVPRSMPGAEMGAVIAAALAEASTSDGSSFAIGVCLRLNHPLKVRGEAIAALLIRFATALDLAALGHIDLVDHVRSSSGSEEGIEARFNREQALAVLERLTGIDAADLRQLRGRDAAEAIGIAIALWVSALNETKLPN